MCEFPTSNGLVAQFAVSTQPRSGRECTEHSHFEPPGSPSRRLPDLALAPQCRRLRHRLVPRPRTTCSSTGVHTVKTLPDRPQCPAPLPSPVLRTAQPSLRRVSQREQPGPPGTNIPRVPHELFTAKSGTVQAVAKYRWPSPPRTAQGPLLIAPAQHDCEFIVPAMDRLICPTCGRDNMSGDADGYLASAPQPDSNDPNFASISKRSRSFRNLTEGILFETSITSDYSIPLTSITAALREKDSCR